MTEELVLSGGDKKSVTRTIRIDSDVNQALEALAGKERISVNLLVNKSLRKHVEWDAYAGRFGFVTLPSTLLIRMLDSMPVAEARSLGAWAGKNFVKEFVLFWFKEITVKNVLSALSLLGSVYARAFQFEYARHGAVHTMILKHGAGRKASALYEDLLTSVMKDLVGIDVRVESTENQVVATFEVKK